MRLQAVADITIVMLFGAIAGIIGAVLYLSGASGASGIILALVLTAAMGLAQWYFSPSIIRLLTRARELSKEEAPGIFETVKRLAKAAEVPLPRLYLVNNPTPNAFAFGRSRSDANIAIHSGLLRALDKDEVEAVLAHEMGHIRHRDVVIMTMASLIPVLLYYIAIILLSSAGGRDERGRSTLAVFAGGMAARFVGQILVLWLSRVREYAADEFAAKISSGKSLAKGLAKISYGLSGKGTNDAIACLYIAEGAVEAPEAISGYLDLDAGSLQQAISRERSMGFKEIFMTHPLTSKRLLALKRLEEAK